MASKKKTIAPIDDVFGGAPDTPFSIAEWFHENTKLSRRSEPQQARNHIGPSAWDRALRVEIDDRRQFIARHNKKYTTATRVVLPRPRRLASSSLQEASDQRRSATGFDPRRVISLGQLSTLLDFAYGLRKGPRKAGETRRVVPSAGALYPMEFYILASRVSGLSSGVLCHYQHRDHSLELIGSCDARESLDSVLAQETMTDAAAVVFITGCLPRVAWKYGERAYRYVLLEAGHVAQNVCLAGAATGVAVCPVAGFYDDVVHDLLWIDGVSEIVVYALCIGRHRTRRTSGSTRRGTGA